MPTDLQRFSQAFESEADLRNQLSTLLTKMGNEGVQITHGTHEYGKDLVFYSNDGVGSRILNACVVKKDKISGSADHDNGARNVFNQVEQALDTPHINRDGEDEPVVRVFVISPFDCKQQTLKSIQGKLKTRFGQVSFLCGSHLLQSFAKHWPEFLAFESSFLGSYVASLQLAFDQEDPIRFLGAQHTLFVGANKNLTNVYVRQNFKLELHDIAFLVDPPDFAILDQQISLDDLQTLLEQIRFVSAFIRNAQAWESGDASLAAKLADFLDSLPSILSRYWEEQWRLHELESAAVGSAAVPRKLARVFLKDFASLASIDESVQLTTVISLFSKRVDEANKFIAKAKSNLIVITDLHSPTYQAFCWVSDLMRSHPVAFRKASRITVVTFPEELLEKISRPMFVTAPAGHGKTSFCKWNTLNDIQRLIDKTGTTAPIYVPLHRLSSTDVASCEDAFLRTPEAKELVEHASKRGQQVRLYLDGLDEVSTVEHQQRLMLLAADIPMKYPFIQVVVTGRDYLTGVWLRWLGRINLAELDDSHIETLVNNWLDGDRVLLTSFQDQLTKTVALKPLMRVPLLGTLIIAVFKRMKSLPESKLKLYEAFTDLMCGGWDLAKNVRRDTRFGSNIKLSVLTRLAGQLHLNGKRDAQASDIKNAIEQTVPVLTTKWNQLLEEIVEDGLLVRAASSTYMFSHLSFQEYLAATELPDPQGNRPLQALKDFLRGEDRGREVITFYLSLVKRPDETEAWIKKTAEELAGKGADLKDRYNYLMAQMIAAWPGWSPRKGPPRI